MSGLFGTDMLSGLLFGGVFAVGDAFLLRWTVRKSGQAAKQSWLARGILARALLTVAAVAIALLLPGINAAGVVIALLIQKAVLVLIALFDLGKHHTP